MTDHALTPETLAELEQLRASVVAAVAPWGVHREHDAALIAAAVNHLPELVKKARDYYDAVNSLQADLDEARVERDAALAEVATLTRQRDGWREAVKTTAEQRERRRAEVVALRERVESWIAERLIGLDPDGLLHPVRLAQAEELRAALGVDTAGHDDSSERDGGRP